MKYAWIAEQKVFSLTEMCRVLDVSISGYRAWSRGGQPDRQRLTHTIPHKSNGINKTVKKQQVAVCH